MRSTNQVNCLPYEVMHALKLYYQGNKNTVAEKFYTDLFASSGGGY